MSNPKKVLIALPHAMLLEVDAVAAHEHRSRSDLVREALRRYLEVFKRKQDYIMTPKSAKIEEMV